MTADPTPIPDLIDGVTIPDDLWEDVRRAWDESCGSPSVITKVALAYGVAAGRTAAAADPAVESLITAVAAWRESMEGLMDDTSPEEDALHDAYEALRAARIAEDPAAKIAGGTDR